jgi:hypothetical protein
MPKLARNVIVSAAASGGGAVADGGGATAVTVTDTPTTLRGDELRNTLDAIIRSTAGIHKKTIEMSLNKFIRLARNGSIQIAEWNRNAVASRPGNANALLESIAMGTSISLILGYMDCILPSSGTKIVYTADQPLQITEGGHRKRWLQEIAEGRATLCGCSLEELREVHPTMYNKIMNYKIVIQITFHESGKVPIEYVKKEYVAINEFACTLAPGEIHRAKTDERFIQLTTALNTALSHHKAKNDKKNRDKGSSVIAAVVQGLAHGPTEMVEKSKYADITVEEADDAMDCIRHIDTTEKHIQEKFRTNKAAKTALTEATSLEFHGAYYWALKDATPVYRNHVDDIWKKFWDKSFEEDNKEIWKQNVQLVKKLGKQGSSNGGLRNNAERYGSAWNILRGIALGPIDADSDEEYDDVEVTDDE